MFITSLLEIRRIIWWIMCIEVGMLFILSVESFKIRSIVKEKKVSR